MVAQTILEKIDQQTLGGGGRGESSSWVVSFSVRFSAWVVMGDTVFRPAKEKNQESTVVMVTLVDCAEQHGFDP